MRRWLAADSPSPLGWRLAGDYGGCVPAPLRGGALPLRWWRPLQKLAVAALPRSRTGPTGLARMGGVSPAKAEDHLPVRIDP